MLLNIGCGQEQNHKWMEGTTGGICLIHFFSISTCLLTQGRRCGAGRTRRLPTSTMVEMREDWDGMVFGQHRVPYSQTARFALHIHQVFSLSSNSKSTFLCLGNLGIRSKRPLLASFETN